MVRRAPISTAAAGCLDESRTMMLRDRSSTLKSSTLSPPARFISTRAITTWASVHPCLSFRTPTCRSIDSRSPTTCDNSTYVGKPPQCRHPCCSFFHFVLERKYPLRHNRFTSLMRGCCSQLHSIIPFLRLKRGFLFFLMVDQGKTSR